MPWRGGACPAPLADFSSSLRSLLARARRQLYAPPRRQQAWGAFPLKHDPSLWFDLLIVAILYRLDRFALDYNCNSESNLQLRFIVPIGVFIAIYDAWEARMLFDACFVTADDLLHQFLAFASWLCLALMGVSLQIDQASFLWVGQDPVVFASLKFAHALIRFCIYVECGTVPPSERTRRAARPRAVAFGLGLPFLLAAPFLAAFWVPEAAAVCWYASYVVQRVAGYLMLYSPSIKADLMGLRVNVPFIIRRFSEWIQVQLGASMLGLITSNALIVAETSKNEAIGCVVMSYLFLANLDLLMYSVSPRRPNEHALVRGGWREALWMELFVIQGIALFGIGVSIRALLVLLNSSFSHENLKYLWIMSASAGLASFCAFLQELMHVGELRFQAGRRSWILKTILIGGYILVPVISIYATPNEQSATLFSLGLALASGIVVVVHIALGGMKREIARLSRVKLKGRMLGAIIARVWLQRARARLGAARLNGSAGAKEQGKPGGVQSITLTIQKHGSFSDGAAREPEVDVVDLDPKQMRQRMQTYLSMVDEAPQDARDDSESESGEDLSTQSDQFRILTKLINANFYLRPMFVAKGDVFAEISADWADLFFDVLYVGVVFRLGDFLLAGLGLEGAHPQPVAFCSAPHSEEGEYQWDAVVMFMGLFCAVLDMWFGKLQYACHVSNSDVAHKVFDLAQGLLVVVMAASLTTPQELSSDTGEATMVIASCLLCFQVSMLLLWGEAAYAHRKSATARHTALFYIWHHVLSVLPLVFSFVSIYFSVALRFTVLLWWASWALPLLVHVHRIVFGEVFKGRYELATPALEGFVEKRLADESMILLGEGLMQVMRSRTAENVVFYDYLVAFCIVGSIRSCLFLTCFKYVHFAKQESWRALLERILRFAMAPALVAAGAALKTVLVSTGPSSLVYWTLSASCCFTAVCFLLLFELQLPIFLEFAGGAFVAGWFLFWPPIELSVVVMLVLVWCTWLLFTLIMEALGVDYDKHHAGPTPVLARQKAAKILKLHLSASPEAHEKNEEKLMDVELA